jgi:outer membrane biosynthesis protein TonB
MGAFMSDLLDRFKKTLEESLETAKHNAQNLKEIAEEYGKVARFKFELHQLQTSRRKKMELLGETVFPFLNENRHNDLKMHETLQVILDNIKNLDNDIELTQKALELMRSPAKSDDTEVNEEQLKNQIQEVEIEIESRIKELRAVKDALKKGDKEPEKTPAKKPVKKAVKKPVKKPVKKTVKKKA